MYPIETQSIDLQGLMGGIKGDSMTVSGFEISELITYGEYKNYLSNIKSDSSYAFYLTQLPDSNMCLENCYTAYITSTKFDSFPVVGISWEAAMNYCKWKTLQQNEKGRIKHIYRLPTVQEWVTAYHSAHRPLDMNQYYSDWLLNTKDESIYSRRNSSEHRNTLLKQVYFAKDEDLKVFKRKVVMGNSFLFQKEKLIDFYKFSYYSFEGYRHVSFRMVKETETDKAQNQKNHFSGMLKFWNLEDE